MGEGGRMSTARRAVLHARVRWTGAPLLLTGAVALVWAVLQVVRGGWLTLGLAALGTGLGLASFGANHDSAMALGFTAIDDGELPPRLRAELDAELARDRSAVMGLRAAPRTALIIPMVAGGVQAYVWWVLLGGGV
jgi:hypothetical protein